jgi:hypothetical protein|tara:strand:+ start:6675 stop:6956 length:282 start_codon:yes stop_codon:yes gene_type:complete
MATEKDKQIGFLLKKKRNEMNFVEMGRNGEGVTKKIAEKLGYKSHQGVYHLENGSKRITIEETFTYCSAIGMSEESTVDYIKEIVLKVFCKNS